MSIKRYKPEQIVTLLRQIEVEIANGKTPPLRPPLPRPPAADEVSGISSYILNHVVLEPSECRTSGCVD